MDNKMLGAKFSRDNLLEIMEEHNIEVADIARELDIPEQRVRGALSKPRSNAQNPHVDSTRTLIGLYLIQKTGARPEYNKEKITEEEHREDKWYASANKQTLDSLPEFLEALTLGYEHDFGTIVYAIVAGMLGTAKAMSSEIGGITTFQASAIKWNLLKEFSYRDCKTGLSIINYDDLLYPGNDELFSGKIPRDIWELVMKEARERLSKFDLEHESTDFIDHLKSIAAGKPPYGIQVRD